MQIDEGLDTGPVYLREDHRSVRRRTSSNSPNDSPRWGAELMLRTLEGILGGTLKPLPQDHASATYAPILKKEDGVIDWSSRRRRSITSPSLQSLAGCSDPVSRGDCKILKVAA